MSVPLDRLYNFLDGLCNHSILIYRWSPHGSKKLEDLTILSDCTLKERFVKPFAIMHDQEPLFFNLWSDEEYYSCWSETVESSNIDKDLAYSQQHLDYVYKLKLRYVLRPSTNFYDRVLIFHSERNSNQVKIFQDNGYEPVYYWSHALISQDWFRYAKLDPILNNYDVNNFSKDFLIYNRAWSGTREYRLKFLEMLLDLNLEHLCLTTFSKFDNLLHYTNHQFKNPNLSIKMRDLEVRLPQNNHNSNASADYTSIDYATCAIEVVLETLFDDNRHHLTEKSLRPIATGKPFLLVATPGSLQYLKSYGFKTFSGLIDESYDTIQDPVERLNAIVKEMERLSSLPELEKKEVWTKLHKIAKYNKKRFFSNKFTNLIHTELKHNFDNAMSVLQNHRTGYYWKNDQAAHRNRPPEQFRLINQWFDEFLAETTSLLTDPSQPVGNSDSLSS